LLLSWLLPMALDRHGVVGSFVNSRGVRLHTKTWYPDSDPIAVVVFLHGWGMSVTNNKAWQRVANMHASHGLICTGLDYSGHGQSDGRRTYIHAEALSLTVDDVLQHVGEFMQHYPDLPVFARSQSLGGLVAIGAALRKPELFRGLALGAPPFELAGWVGLLDRWNLIRWHAVPTAAAFVRRHIGNLAVPLAVFQGLEDTTSAPCGAQHLCESAGSQDKSLYLYKDMGHNMSMEPDVLDWLLSRIKRTSSSFLLYIRKPIPGVPWPPPPGTDNANSNTVVEVIPPPEVRSVLDKLFHEGKKG